MATVEIDEVELANMRRLTQTIDTIIRHPQARKLAEQAHKIVNPHAPTPALEQEQMVRAPVDELRKEMSDFIAETKKDREEREKQARLSEINAKVEAGKAQLRRNGWTDEGLKAVEDLMHQKGLLDPLDAAAIYERDHPPAVPATPSGSGNWDFLSGVQQGEDDLKKLIDSRGESSALIDKMARDALNEVRGASRR